MTIMRNERIRRLVVTKHGKLAGIVADQDLLNASPSPVTSLSVWELNYLLSKITVGQVMTKEVLTVQEDTPIEEAARMMADHKVGGLPVMRHDSRGDHVVGIITETDLFKMFLELMGARDHGVRATILLEDEPGQLSRLTHAIEEQGGNIVALGTFDGEDPSNGLITLKVADMELEAVQKTLEPLIERMVDIRVCCG